MLGKYWYRIRARLTCQRRTESIGYGIEIEVALAHDWLIEIRIATQT